MKQLVFPGESYLKWEKNVQEYLSSLSDNELKNFHDAIEFTHFPVILLREYKKRFNKKSKVLKKNPTKK